MPYKRFRKTLYKKVRGKWTKKKTFPSANKAREAMKRLRKLEESSKRKR
jgi:predicted metalloendopeptidase